MEDIISNEVQDLITEVFNRLKSGQKDFSDVDFEKLFCYDQVMLLRVPYRDLLIQIIKLDDANPLKQKSYDFMSKILQDGTFAEASVVMAMVYFKMTDLSTEWLCKNCDALANLYIRKVICNILQSRLDAGFREDVLNATKDPLTEQEIANIHKVLQRYNA